MADTVDRYAVIGNPVAHSKSPQIHQAFAEQTGERIEYGHVLGIPGRFDERVVDFFGSGGKGLNVTVPFKEEAWQLTLERSDRAETARAVNTLMLTEDNRLQGDNTDGVGLVRDLTQNQGAALEGARILLLGAGGAVRGVLQPLIAAGPERILIANRTTVKALDLAHEMADLGPVEGCGFFELGEERFDLIINGTAAGLLGPTLKLPPNLLIENGWCYDMMYGSQPSVFMKWGEAQGAAKVVDGLGMLVEQAAESFYLWRGVRPDTAAVIRSLRRGGGS